MTVEPPPAPPGPPGPPPPSPPPRPPDAADAYLGRLQVRRRRLRLGIAAVLVVSLGGLAAAALVLRAASRAGTDADAGPDGGPPDDAPYVFAHPDDPAALAKIDHARVHGELFPAWIVACAHAVSHEAWQHAQQVFGELRAAVAPDANLVAILDELQTWAGENTWEHAARILVLYQAWSDYLGRHGVPFEVRAVVHEGGSDPPWVGARFYATLAAPGVRVGTRPVDVRIVRRADPLNTRELYLGVAHEEGRGARVLVDRMSDFALAELWPLLCPPPVPGAPDPLEPWQRSLAPRVVAEIEAALPPASVALLRRTAAPRACLMRVVRQVDERAACGNRFGFNFVPWNGLSAESLASTARRAERDVWAACPQVTTDEAEDLARCSAELAAVPEARPALERLTAWAARATTVHEARHLADAADAEAGRPLDCPACRGFSEDARQELSAYLASFAHPGTGFAALYQACSFASKQAGGPAVQALEMAFGRLLPDGCEGTPPEGLPAAAEALQREAFGRAEPVHLAADFPETLPVVR